MATRKDSKSTGDKPAAKKKAAASGARSSEKNSPGKAGGASSKTRRTAAPAAPVETASIVNRITDFAESAFHIASRGSSGIGSSLRLGKAILSKSPDSLRAMQEAGASLRDLREVAGLTRRELSEALEMRDESLIEAVENGTATLSFELILRLAAVLARHDPIPFVIRFTRTYRPELWQLLDDWGVGRVPLQIERERHFINMYRSHDAARRLSDEGFDKVLQFTRSAFEAALHFAAEMEGVSGASSDDGAKGVEEEEAGERAQKRGTGGESQPGPKKR